MKALIATACIVVILIGGSFICRYIYNAFDLGGEHAREAEEKNVEIDHDWAKLQHRTDLETDKVEAQIAKEEHRPNPNATKEIIDETLLDGAWMTANREWKTQLDNAAGSFDEVSIWREYGTKYGPIPDEKLKTDLAALEWVLPKISTDTTIQQFFNVQQVTADITWAKRRMKIKP